MKERLVREMVERQLAYRSSVLEFGERGRKEKELKTEMAKLSFVERKVVKDRVEEIKFARIKSLFENYYR